jgi:hypothetical protein
VAAPCANPNTFKATKYNTAQSAYNNLKKLYVSLLHHPSHYPSHALLPPELSMLHKLKLFLGEDAPFIYSASLAPAHPAYLMVKVQNAQLNTQIKIMLDSRTTSGFF